MKLGFVGLGIMGFPMAGHLQAAGHEVTVYNRTATKAQQWVQTYNGQQAASPLEAATDAQIVFLCVGDDDDVRSVVLGDNGIYAGASAGAVVVDHTTASADLARHLQCQAADRGLGFLDAPVSGGQAGAVNGALTIMVGGEQVSYDAALPVLQVYARRVRLLGPAGSGQLAKMVNQICIAGVVQGLAEALQFSQQAGLDSAAVIEVISQGAAQSWQMENRGRTMVRDEFEFGFAVDWMRKDLAICLDESNRNKALLPLTALVDQLYASVQAQGGGRWDTSSLMKNLTRD